MTCMKYSMEAMTNRGYFAQTISRALWRKCARRREKRLMSIDAALKQLAFRGANFEKL